MATGGNYWFVDMVGCSNFATNDEGYERIKAAIAKGERFVEITGDLNETTLVNVNQIGHIDESTPEIRENAYLWNKASDEEQIAHRRKHGKAEDFAG